MDAVTQASTEPAGVLSPLTATVLAGASVWAVWRVMVATAWGQRIDELALRGSTIGAWRLSDQFAGLLESVSIPAIVLAAVLALLLGATRRQWLAGFVGAGVMLGANVTTQVLKNWVFTRPLFPSDGIADFPNSLPSGHTTVAASVMLGFLIVVPAWLRVTWAMLAAVVITAFGYATLVNQWHRPSDTVAAVGVAACWTFLGVFVLRLISRVNGRPLVRRRPGVFFVVLLLAAVIALGVAGVCWFSVRDIALSSAVRTTQFAAYAGGAALLASLSCLTSGMALLMLQTAPGERVRKRLRNVPVTPS